jgi:Flp pilus assembly protein TadG
MKIPKFLRFRSDHRASTAVVFGLAAPAMMAITGLAIDFAGVLAAKTRLELGADSGALIAVTTATNALKTDQNNYQANGQTAGNNRFKGQAGGISRVSAPVGTVVVSPPTSGLVMTATTTWSATYNTFFGGLFGVPSWQLSGVASASTQVPQPYLNIEVMLDNSPSMEIGATANDIAILQQLTACSPSGAYIPDQNGHYTAPISGQGYDPYQCTGSSSSANYTGLPACPLQASSSYTAISTFQPVAPGSGTQGPSCAGVTWPGVTWPVVQNAASQALGNPPTLWPQAGAPCAFACHFDTSSPSGTGSDYYAIARSTIKSATSAPVTLRFDVVKAAVNTLISTMAANNNTTLNNLQVGVFTFAEGLDPQVYPTTGGEAGGNWATAASAVGGPPTKTNGPDLGIQPYSGSNTADSDFPDSMAALAGQLTAAGNGTTASAPRKVLFLVTDGVQDYNVNAIASSRNVQAMDPSQCQTFKDKGYTIYVVYTPYYPLMNDYYLNHLADIVEGTGAGTTTANLQACASAPSNYIEASDGPHITAALQTFFQLAIAPPARFSH